jgi:phosphatidylglycerol:prolipoprotein diacylglycerol transferase
MYIFEASILGFHIAPTWYWLMYAIGFSFCYSFVGKYWKVARNKMDTLLLYIFFWVIGGGRLGYVLFYNPSYFMSNPEEIVAIWNGGMSFHGGFLWVLIAVCIFGWKYRYRFFDITDILAVCLPIALGLGRIGNWINSELPWYAGYSWPFAMTIWDASYFPNPLLQAWLEGIVLFAIMLFSWRLTVIWTLRPRPWVLSSIFLIWYALVRLFAEQFRLPDEHIGYLFGTWWITLGIVYTLPMLIAGLIIFIQTWQKKETNE